MSCICMRARARTHVEEAKQYWCCEKRAGAVLSKMTKCDSLVTLNAQHELITRVSSLR